MPEKFARRVEEGSLVLWRPGLTIWLNAWENNQKLSQTKQLAAIKKSASMKRTAEHEAIEGNFTRYSYRLQDENDDGEVESLYAFMINDDRYLQMAIYFDDLADEKLAQQLADSVHERK